MLLKGLAGNDDVKKKIVEAGAPGLVLMALNRHMVRNCSKTLFNTPYQMKSCSSKPEEWLACKGRGGSCGCRLVDQTILYKLTNYPGDQEVIFSWFR